jgi:hypothetical protein
LLLPRSPTPGDSVTTEINSTYSDLLIPSNEDTCPVIFYHLQDPQGNWAEYDLISIVNPAPELGPSGIRVMNDEPFTEVVRIPAFIGDNSDYLEFTVQVCGDEELSLVDTEPFKIVMERPAAATTNLLDADRYFELSQAEFESLYELTPPDHNCQISSYDL